MALYPRLHDGYTEELGGDPAELPERRAVVPPVGEGVGGFFRDGQLEVLADLLVEGRGDGTDLLRVVCFVLGEVGEELDALARWRRGFCFSFNGDRSPAGREGGLVGGKGGLVGGEGGLVEEREG